MAGKKIVFHLHNLSRGGAERVVVNLAARFASDGYTVSIITEEQSETEYAVPDGVRRINAGEKPVSGGMAARLISLRKRCQRLRKLLKNEHPDIVVAFGKSANYRAVAAAAGICPVLVSVRNDPKVDYAGKLNALFCRRYLYRADGCVFQTKEAQMFFAPVLRQKSRIILNPIHDKYLQTALPQSRKPIIVTVGRMAAQKNHALLFRSIAALAPQFSQYRLHLYGADSGDGTKEVLDKLMQELDLKERIVFCGNSDRLEQEIVDCALFVLSSDYEGLPNALMEAMAMQMPVISTDCPCGGPALLIEDGVNGRLVPVGDQNAMTVAMEEMLGNPELAERMGIEAGNIRSSANGDTVYRQWKDYVETLCTQASAKG